MRKAKSRCKFCVTYRDGSEAHEECHDNEEFRRENACDLAESEVNTHKPYQPKTGEKCHCKRGIERDNCPNCEGTGWRIDFRAIRERTDLSSATQPTEAKGEK